MSDYLEVYRKRMQNNHDKLLAFAEELKKVGCKVYAVHYVIKDGAFIDYIHVRRDGKAVNVGFAEVPYRWYIGSEYSGYVIYVDKVLHYDFPFSVEDVISRLKESKKLDSMYVEI